MESQTCTAIHGTIDSSLSPVATVSPSTSLNFDIVDYVLQFLPQSDLLNTMLASRALHSAALRHLLSERRIYPEEPTSGKLFCDFLMNDPAHRCGMLRRLRISASVRSPGGWPTRLVDVLSHAWQLEELDLLTDRITLNAVPELFRCLITLERLRSFALYSTRCIPTIYELIAQRTAPLTRLQITFMIPDDRPSDASKMLAPSAPVLEMVALSSVAFMDASAQYHRVRELHITLNSVSYDSAKLVHMFPNLQVLRFLPGSQPTRKAAKGAKARNKRAQANRRWSSLSYFTGCYLSMYAAGLLCKVDHLNIDFGGQTAGQLAELIEDTMPHHLTFHIYPFSDFDGCGRAIAGGAESLHQLTLRVDFVEYIWDSWDELRGSILPLLDHTRIVDLSISIHYQDREWDVEVYPTVEEFHEAWERGVNLLAAIDVGDFVHEMTRLAPSLRRVRLELPYNSESEWQIAPGASGEPVVTCTTRKLWDDDDVDELESEGFGEWE